MNIRSLLLGQTEEHIFYLPDQRGLHKDMVNDFLELKNYAQKENFSLKIASGYRSYQRQQLIWDEKLSGKRNIYDHSGQNIVNPQDLSTDELIFTILRWSALPGMSRHHWGTDLDIYDNNALLKTNHKLQLIPEEYNHHGIMNPFFEWLIEMIQTKFKDKFYFPYLDSNSPIAEERWHISYIPLAIQFEKIYTYDFFTDNFSQHSLSFKNIILDNSDQIYHDYFRRYFHSAP